ncbi:MAG: c-type cytochrome [Longimicrobiales bacterium]
MRTNRGFGLVAAIALGLATACGGEPDMGDDEPDAEPPPASPATTPPASQPAPPAGELPAGVTQEMVTQGQQIFTSTGNCFTCHGQDATGTQLAPNLTDSEWINIEGDYESIVENVRTGVPQPVQHPAPMPPMGGAQLTDEQVRAVAAYVYAISRGS